VLSIAATLLVAALWLPAQDPAGPQTPAAPSEAAVTPAADMPDAAALLAKARESFKAYRTLKATMTETIDFGPARRFRAEGVYLQGAGNKVRVDLTVEVGKNKGHLLQVCEGDILWTVYDTGTAPKVTRRDLKQILAATKEAETKSTWLNELGLGGLPALLAAVEGSIDFKPTMKTVIEGRNFYVLEGSWKPAVRQQFEAQLQQSPSPPNGPKMLPNHVPELVRVFLDAETLFPYRIRYLKQSPAAGEEPRPLLTLDFSGIVVNASIDAEEFRYSAPEGAQVMDVTTQYLDQLKAQPTQGQPAVPGPPASPPQ
jgi:outer membrane lipoprotein-sorting protein